MEEIKNILSLLIVSMTPILEIKGAIPFGITVLNMNMIEVFIICVIGSSISGILVITMLPVILKKFRKFKVISKIEHYLYYKSYKKSVQRKIERFGYFALFLFVAIPFPTTGVYTGSGISVILKLKKKKSIIAVILGNVACAIIITSMIVNVK